MGLFPALAIIIVVVVIIIIVIVISVIAINNTNNSDSDNGCQSQADCDPNFVCVPGTNGSKNTCKAGTGTACSSDNDCAPNLICLSTGGTSVCAPQPVPTNTVRRKVAWGRTGFIRNPPAVLPTPPVTPPVTIRSRVSTPLMLSSANVTPVSHNWSVTPISGEIRQSTRQQLPRRSHHAASITSTDDEINSDGDREEVPFDIRSAESTRDNDDYHGSVSTPCEERDGVYYCRPGKSEIIEDINEKSAVIDVCSYSDATVFLLENGNIIYEIARINGPKTRVRANNNVHLKRISGYDGYLYGVGVDGKLYTLPNSCLTISNWVWSFVEWAPLNITHISSTHDTSHIWIQTDNYGHLFRNAGVLLSKITIKGKRRIYGKDIDNYVELDDEAHTAVVYPAMTTLDNVVDAALSYYNEITTISTTEAHEYRSIAIVNWKPYYIRV